MIGRFLIAVVVPVAGVLWYAGYGPLQSHNPLREQREIERGWYQRADTKPAVPALPAGT